MHYTIAKESIHDRLYSVNLRSFLAANMTETPWTQQYPLAIPPTIDATKYRSLIHLMEELFTQYGDLPMCENMGKILTFHAVDKLSKSFAAYLQQQAHLTTGSTIAIQLPNLLQYPIALLGALRAGLVIVNINPQYTPHEMAYQLKDAGTRAIIILENFAHKLTEILPQTAIQTIIITKVGDMLGNVKGRVLNFVIKHIKKLIPSYHLPQTIPFKEALAKGKKLMFHPIALQPTHIALLQYTGGTTGVPKGAILTHGNLTANCQQAEPFIRLVLKEKIERAMIPLPLYHIFGLSSLLLMAKLGAKSLLITNPRDIPSFIKAWKQYKPTCLIGIGTLFEKLLINSQFNKISFATFKYTFAGGMQTHEEIKKQWEAVTGSKVVEGYGLTECGPGVAGNIINGIYHLPFPSTLIKIADESGKALPHGQAGELLVKGPQVSPAYWQKQAETQKAFSNGWFKTGDIAIMYAEGFAIVDRKKDMINISGFNVYPNEIESVLIGHPKVLEVGAVGVADMKFKEAIKVFIVKKDATLTTEEIIAYCREKLTRYKIPKYVEFCKRLPKSPIGKVLRKLLKQQDTQNPTSI